MASPPSCRVAGAPAEQLLLPDEILEDIFLRMNSGYDLARASATCRAFRRVATGRPFLRRFLSLHPPPIVGFIVSGNRGLFQAEPPHRSAPAARAVAQAGDFMFSFLPSASHPNSSWCTHDVRDGRFLLSRQGTVATTLELVVCDPLYRRYVQIPPIPRDIVPRTPPSDEMKSEPFLAPADEEESDKESHFRVIYNWLSDYKVVSFVFSSATRKWFHATSFSFVPARLILKPTECVRYYARNCFFWMYLRRAKYMLMFDPREMKFVILELLHYDNAHPQAQLALIDAAEDRLGLISLDQHKLDLYSRTCQNNCLGEEDWRRDNSISLPVGYSYYIIIASEGYLLLRGYPTACSPEGQKIQCFVVDLKTFLVETLSALDASTYPVAHPYASFPPPFSLPRL